MIETDEKDLFFRMNEASGPFVVLLYTPFCGTCNVAKRMLSVVEAMLPSIPQLQVNINYTPRLIARFQVKSVPCLLVFTEEETDMPIQIYEMRSVEHLYSIIKGMME